MGAVNISDVLYVFTGKYPVYIVEEDDVLKVYLYAKKDPTYAELVVTGHNLLENDYEELYFGEVTEPEAIAFLSCLLYTSPSPRDKRQSRMPSSA